MAAPAVPPREAGPLPGLRLHIHPSLQGFEYQERSGQCCGVCVQQACVVNASDGSTHVFSVSGGRRAWLRSPGARE